MYNTKGLSPHVVSFFVLYSVLNKSRLGQIEYHDKIKIVISFLYLFMFLILMPNVFAV